MRKITDIWFRSEHSLEELKMLLDIQNPEFDAENYWEWVIGEIGDSRINMSRTHTVAPCNTDTRIFLLGSEQEFNEDLISSIIQSLQKGGIASISLGHWEYLSSNDYNRHESQNIRY